MGKMTCFRGHDIALVGRNSQRNCRECVRQKDRVEYQNRPCERRIFQAMRKRCTNPRYEQFHRYGGRGIRVLYRSYQEFFLDVGPRPSKEYSIDRINVDGNYEPGNCRWATAKQQANNRRKP